MNKYPYSPYSTKSMQYPTYTDGYYRSSRHNMQRNYNIKVEGIGIINIKPDIAKVVLGVETEDEDLKVAQEENTKLASNIISALKELGVDDKDIKTIDYSVEKIYEYNDGERIFKGYKVTNKIQVTIRDIKRVGEIIDRAIEEGANVVGNIQFDLSNKDEYYDEALSLAVEDALIKAQNIGKTIGVNVNKVPLRIEEIGFNTYHTPSQPSFREPDQVTPIKPGELEVKARVEAEFVYSM